MAAVPCKPLTVYHILVAAACVAASLAMPTPAAAAPPPTETDLLQRAAPPAAIASRLRRYAPTELRVKGGVPDELLFVLRPLRRAADHIDRVFWNQLSDDGLLMYDVLSRAASPEAKQLARLMGVHYGPWDGHADDSPFLGTQRRPPGANFYPRDASARELDEWLEKHPEARALLWSSYSVVARLGTGFEAIPYSKAYADELKPAAVALRQAADAIRCQDGKGAGCKCKGLADFLRARADALGTDEFRKSEMLWMDTGACPLDVVIGPYEFYEDRLLGLKTAYEAVLYYRDPVESARFEKLFALHKELAAGLPLPDHVRSRFDSNRPSPIIVADVIYTAGDARHGYQIRAFALPNDEAVRSAKGTKNVILRNVVRAKFDALARPVAQRLFEPELADKVSFDAYFHFLVTWQLSHGLAPQPIERSDGTRTTPREALRARHSLVESLKGEVVALLNHVALIDKGLLPGQTVEGVAATYLASLVDALRLSEGSPQTVAKTIVYNYLARHYAFRYLPETRHFEVGADAIRPALTALAVEALQILARGDYEGAGRLVLTHGLLPGELREKIASLADLPVDILPVYASMPAADKPPAVATP